MTQSLYCGGPSSPPLTPVVDEVGDATLAGSVVGTGAAVIDEGGGEVLERVGSGASSDELRSDVTVGVVSSSVMVRCRSEGALTP